MDTIFEFADFMKVHHNTVLKWITKGMPAIKTGGTTRIDRQEAVNWLKENSK